MAKERVQKIISAAGLCSRREAEKWIEEGRVQVNGKVVEIGESATRQDKITVNGAPIEFPEPIYVMMNKPKGFITTQRGTKGQRTVQELIPYEERLYSVGRLDRDTTGLLLFTNDGDFSNKIMHPRYEIEKTYQAVLDRPFEKKDALRFKKGIRLEEGTVYSNVKAISTRKVEVKLHQGYKHVVKRIFDVVGYRVKELTRTRIGSLHLDIPEGAVRELKRVEVEALLKAAIPRPRPPQRRSRPRGRAGVEYTSGSRSYNRPRHTSASTSRNPGPRSSQ